MFCSFGSIQILWNIWFETQSYVKNFSFMAFYTLKLMINMLELFFPLTNEKNKVKMDRKKRISFRKHG